MLNQDCIELVLDFAPLADLLALRSVCRGWQRAVGGVLVALNGGTSTAIDTSTTGCSAGVLRRYRMISHDALVKVLLVCLRRDGEPLASIRIPPRTTTSDWRGVEHRGTAIPDIKWIARCPRAAELATVDVGGSVTSAEYLALCRAAAPSIRLVRGPIAISRASTELELLAMPSGRLTSLSLHLAPRGVGLFERCMDALLTPLLTELSLESDSPMTIGSLSDRGLFGLAPNLARLRLSKVELAAVHWEMPGGATTTNLKHLAARGPFLTAATVEHLRRFVESNLPAQLVSCDLQRAVHVAPPSKQPTTTGDVRALLAAALQSTCPELRELVTAADAVPHIGLSQRVLPKLERLVLSGASRVSLDALVPQSLTSIDVCDVADLRFTSLGPFCCGGRWLRHLGVSFRTATSPVRDLDPLRLVAHSLVSLRIVAEDGFTFPDTNGSTVSPTAALADVLFLETLEVHGGDWFRDVAFLRERPALHLRSLDIQTSRPLSKDIVDCVLNGQCPALEELGTGGIAMAGGLHRDDQLRLLRVAPRLRRLSGVDISAAAAFLPVEGGFVHVLRSFRRV